MRPQRYGVAPGQAHDRLPEDHQAAFNLYGHEEPLGRFVVDLHIRKLQFEFKLDRRRPTRPLPYLQVDGGADVRGVSDRPERDLVESAGAHHDLVQRVRPQRPPRRRGHLARRLVEAQIVFEVEQYQVTIKWPKKLRHGYSLLSVSRPQL